MFSPAAGMALFAVNPIALWIGCGALGLVAAAVVLREQKAA
jgi:hypothetical protein